MNTRFNIRSRFADQTADTMREQYGITHHDLARIQAFAAVVHARIGLPLNTYFAGMNRFLDCFHDIALQAQMSHEERLAVQSSVAKLLHLDTAIVVDTYNAIIEETLTAQANALLEMSTPVTHIWAVAHRRAHRFQASAGHHERNP